MRPRNNLDKRLIGVVTVVLTSCGPIPDDVAKSWESIHRPVFLPGYRDYRAEVDGTEDGYVVVSYRLPADVPRDEALERLREHVSRQFPCYQVIEQTATTLALRCPGGRMRGGHRWDEEYRAVLRARDDRLFFEVLDDVKRSHYPALARVANDQAARAE